MHTLSRTCFVTLLWCSLVSLTLAAPEPAPERDRGDGPFQRLILRGVTVVAGNGAPPAGPMDIVIENDRIVRLVSVGNPGAEIDPDNRPQAGEGDQEMDLSGHYVLPGFVDMHGHLGGDEQGVTAEYVLKLWLAHGITTVREPGSFNGLDWVLDHVRRSNANSIVAPRIIPYAGFGLGAEAPISTPKHAREWVQDIARQGAMGVKFFGAPPAIMQAAFAELNQQNLGSAMHHAQLNVVRWNVLDSARAGLTTMEHWYGLPEAMFDDQVIQDYPLDYNYNNEQHRFGEAGRLWQQAAAPGSERWNAVRDELIELDFTINPTLTIYEASRDLMREQRAIWHDDYAHPRLLEFFQPSPEAHGSYWFDWTTQNEIDWKQNYQRWMHFLNDYKNHGGRVTTGSDAGYIYKLYGFGYIRELELLQEAGFHPLEVLQAATLNGAEALGMADEIGSIEVGKKADLVVVTENPLRNFKLLYGTGHYRLREDGTPGYVRGLRYTIKDGIVYAADELLQDVRDLVTAAKTEAEAASRAKD
ncbi:MAG: amidohydrolase family protein [Wenzhouxiangellaceae bacterium]